MPKVSSMVIRVAGCWVPVTISTMFSTTATNHSDIGNGQMSTDTSSNPNAPLNDLYQDVILNRWKAYPKFRRECKMSTWIYRIALNTCISFFRKEKNVPEIVTLTREADWIIEEHDPIHEMLRQLYQMINQLGQLDKSIILLYLEDKSYEDIAEITGLTVTNVATKLSRIKDKLKKMKKE